MANLYDHLVFWARLSPKAPALQSLKIELNFLQLLRLTRRFATGLREAGVKPGHVVIVATPNKDIDWIVTLALMHEGAITNSTPGYEAVGSGLAHDWVVTDAPEPKLDGTKTIRLTNEWIAAAKARRGTVTQRRYESGASPARIFMTSGTTGHSKAVALTMHDLVARARASLALRGPHNAISVMGLASAGGFNSAAASLIAGQPVYASRSVARTAHCITRFSIEGVYGSPAQIAAVVNALKGPGELPSIKSVRIAGGAVSQALVKNIAERLSPNIMTMYGSTEAGGMAAHRPQADTTPSVAGYLQPDAQVEIVDAEGNAVEAGQEGSIRIRTPHMANGYWKNPKESERSFRGGWFYPGDRGRWGPGRLLELAGRDTDLLNAGGVKVDPVPLEQFLCDVPGVQDAAVFVVEAANGAEQLTAAIVCAGEIDADELRRACTAKFGLGRAPRVYMRANAIPRNEAGKIIRARLGTQFAQELKSA
ncbi:class I adenylate-forming enzyme family protein [Caenimonas sp. SL110]|uniref:class I adenylate-forming enzyme family protein n=1 Tax=Caenimonas sp. SL110 TaxID=1450524 RepID=UPI0006547220|nr:class I adenylate-forming enzyme family protein [Caenimonas sp. SL110]